ncbi:MAG: hypothetical protein FGM46_05940, partial [Ferruginibacter sp.]|nr:hypothetical protein [Ferruginibacter sp.]
MPNASGFHFDNSYSQLPEKFFVKTSPVPVTHPSLILYNAALATESGLQWDMKRDAEMISKIFSGNELPIGAEPIAQAYAGHQFGHFTMLGDGRAIL